MRRIRTVLVAVAILALAAGAMFNLSSVSAAQSTGGTIYTDDMSNAAIGLLSETSPDPYQYSYDYKNGQFIAQAVDTRFQGEIFSFANTPILADSNTSVDVGIGGADEREIYGFVGCRAGSSDEGYMFLLEPTTGRAAIWRQDASGPVLLDETFVRYLVTPGNNQFNRIEIDCYLDQIIGTVNGVDVLQVFDSTYLSGLTYIGIGNSGGAADNLFGVFDNLMIIDAGYAAGDVVQPGTQSIQSATLPGVMIAGPLAGTLGENASSVSSINAGVVTSDFFTTATFVAPNNSVPWDFTVGFRDSGGGNEFRLTIFSNGQWRLSMGTGPAIASGTVTNLAAVPGQVNRVDLLVQGVNGSVALNGQDFAALNLANSTVAGDVWIATGSANETTQVGRSTTFSDFEVWSVQ